MIRTVSLKNDALLLSSVITLLIAITFLLISGFDHQIQNTEATSVTPTDSSPITDLIKYGGEMLNSSRYEEALVSFDRALKIDSRSVEALNGKGLVLNQLGEYEEAITLFDKTLEINPHFVDAMYNKADALGELGKYEEALVWTDRALTLKPVTTHNNSNSRDLLLPND